MKRAFAIILMLCMTAFMAVSFAQNAPTTGTINGEILTSGTDGALMIRYSLPQFDGNEAIMATINAYYADLAQDLTASQMVAETLQGSPDTLDMSFRIAHASSRYLSVVLDGVYLYAESGAETPSVAAQTFALDGVYSGKLLTLSQMLGLEQSDDELSDQVSLAEELAYQLVWQIVERNCQNADSGYLDALTFEQLRSAFYPETDFYLDENGNVVFFIQAGEIAGEMAGVLTFPFAPEELLSAR